jgi:WD40 repeat protein
LRKKGDRLLFFRTALRERKAACPLFCATASSFGAVLLAALAVAACERRAAAPDAGGPTIVQDAEGVWHLRGHPQPIYSVAISSDGTHAATGAGDRTVRVWDLKRPGDFVRVSGANEAITALAFSPKGDLIAAGDRAFTVRVIRVSNGAVVRAWPHPDSISTVDFSPDGQWVAVAGFQGNAAIYPVDRPGPAKCDWRGRSAQFTDGGTRVVVANAAGSVALYEFPSCALLKETSTKPQLPFAAVSGKAELIATRDAREKDVLLWNAVDGAPLGRLEGHAAGVSTLQLSADGARALTASEDGTVRLWDVAKHSELARWIAQGTPFAAMADDGTTVVIGAGLEARVVRR